MAIKAVLGSAGLHIFDNFSHKCESRYGGVETAYRSFRPTRSSLGTLIHLAQEGGWTPPRKEKRTGGNYKDPHIPANWEEFLAGCQRPEDFADDADTAAPCGLIRDAGLDYGPIPPRAWLLGNTFCRTFVSSLVADGGTGKTAIRVVQMIALASGRNLTGEHVFQRSKVLFISLEDNDAELRRRIEAALIYHGVSHDEVKGWFYYASLGHKGFKFNTKGHPTSKDLGIFLSEFIQQTHIDLICLDPFIKSHSETENDNNAIDLIVGILAGLATRFNLAIDAPHHMAKGIADPGNANRGRGASAFKDGARLVYTLSRMTDAEGKKFNISPDECAQYVRVDPAKVNIAPSARNTKWFKIVGVPLGNNTPLYPNGDEVQTVEPWIPPQDNVEMSDEVRQRIIDAIDKGTPSGDIFTDSMAKTPRSVRHIFSAILPNTTDEQIKNLIPEWIEDGHLRVIYVRDKKNWNNKRGLVSPARAADLERRGELINI